MRRSTQRPAASSFRRFIETLQAKADEAGATIEVDIPADLNARADADALERILLNLVENAFRHAGNGVAVELSAERSRDRLTIEVSDNGSGVPEDIRARLFEHFQRGGKRGGAGLGLAIARELAQALGGSLTLADSNRGARFVVELPASSA